ncbi:hypothetical protein GCM10010413_15330 [Promicromonospora sukumoe]
MAELDVLAISLAGEIEVTELVGTELDFGGTSSIGRPFPVPDDFDGEAANAPAACRLQQNNYRKSLTSIVLILDRCPKINVGAVVGVTANCLESP